MLDLARRKLRSAVAALAPAARAGVPILVLEPGCASVFRDELRDLLPDDDDVRSVAAATVLLSELLARTPGWRPPARTGRAIVQAHCHHASVLGFDAERSVLAATGIEAEVLDSGCCGMAGAFGYERGERYRVSIAAGERVLLPAVRAASPETLVLADGFSCREQIRQGAGRRALHLAELLAGAPGEAR
jgi:Fe-S oxidoreductase